ncbi:MAG: rhodanese-like domain-containing protein [Sideroxydans sp.]|nr:rhodanese-like domain-containing protein [Sideroxydans sp.]
MAEFKNITAEELQHLLPNNKVQLVDVRTDAEIARGRIVGALALPLHLLPMRMGDLDAALTTVFYCQMGGRSAQAAAFAAAQGHSDVFNLQGGITAWAHSGGEIVA